MQDTNYTYIIHKESTGEYYIGVRSCLGSPHDDPYMGSCSEELQRRFKHEGDWHKYIIQEYPSRREANEDEVRCFEGHLDNGLCLNTTGSKAAVKKANLTKLGWHWEYDDIQEDIFLEAVEKLREKYPFIYERVPPNVGSDFPKRVEYPI